MEYKKQPENISVKLKPQVPGILTEKEKLEKVNQLKNHELYFRAIGYRQ